MSAPSDMREAASWPLTSIAEPERSVSASPGIFGASSARRSFRKPSKTPVRTQRRSALKILNSSAPTRARPRVIVVDPPRKGMSEEAVRAVCSMGPQRVVYVSCDPATLARDILRFTELGYTLREATAVDMFPRTCHVETAALLSRGKE